MKNEVTLSLIVFAVVCIATGIYFNAKTKSPTDYQYATATINLSKCEYIVARKNPSEAWIIVAHKGDCSFCSTNRAIRLLSK